MEIPEDMQKKYGFAPLGAATGPVKTAIFSGNNMRLYDIQQRSDRGDRFDSMKQEYIRQRRRAQQPALRLRAPAGGLDRVNVLISGFAGAFMSAAHPGWSLQGGQER